MLKYIKRPFSILNNSSIIVSNNAWDKMKDILKNPTAFGFLFSAQGGGCNGFNYNLKTIDKYYFDDLYTSRVPPILIKNGESKLLIDSKSEMLLIGTTIDYIKEDYVKNIFESKFIFTPKKELATTCGCGISFTPNNLP
jgi:iron-sulfur cluster assembly accessory protein